jgi:hypothetical protein
MADKSIKTAGNWLVIVPKEGRKQVIDGRKRLPKGASRLAGFAVSDDAYLFLNAVERRESPPPAEDDYSANADSDAKDMARNFLDEIVEQLHDDNEASDDYNNDYPGGDSYHHETHQDKAYDLDDAVKVLRQLSQYEETDDGLWEGLGAEEQISARAAYTYGNAVGSIWSDIIKKINSEFEDVAPVLATCTAYEDIDEAKELRGKLQAGEINESDDNCEIQLRIVQAVIDGKDADAAIKEEIKKLVERVIDEF